MPLVGFSIRGPVQQEPAHPCHPCSLGMCHAIPQPRSGDELCPTWSQTDPKAATQEVIVTRSVAMHIVFSLTASWGGELGMFGRQHCEKLKLSWLGQNVESGGMNTVQML